MKQLRNPVFNLLACSCLVFAASGAHAAEPLALQKIMKDLGENMQVITDGISREDWELVEKTAPLIADHPQPPMAEKLRIMRFAGTRMGKFKAHDGETHDQAQAVGRAAKARDGRSVILAFNSSVIINRYCAAKARDGPSAILAFQKLQTSCYNCHSEFRKSFVDDFYGRKDTAQ